MDSQSIPNVSYIHNVPETKIDLPQTEDAQYSPPPLYEDVVSGRASFPITASNREPGAAAACNEMFGKGITYWRMFNLLCIITGIILLSLWKSVLYAALWAVITGAVLLGLFYILYLCNTFCCNNNLKYLKTTALVAEVQQHVENVRSGTPSVVFHMECYHYETRTTGSGKNRRTTTSRRTTWVGDQPFEFTFWRDVSDPSQLASLGTFRQTRIKFAKEFVLSDPQTLAMFERQREFFFAANVGRDSHYSLTTNFNIEGFEPAMLASTTHEKPFFLTLHWYVLAVVFLLELPFSFLIKKQSARMDYVYLKQLGISQMS